MTTDTTRPDAGGNGDGRTSGEGAVPREPTLARPLAPEDVRPGMAVTLLEEIGQHVPFCCSEPHVLREAPYRFAWLPSPAGRPLRVVEVCLPFVLVEDAKDKPATLDVRQCRLALLDEGYAREARKRLGAASRAKRKRKKVKMMKKKKKNEE